MKVIKLPYIPVTKEEVVLDAKYVTIEDREKYLYIGFWAKVEIEEEDDMGIKDVNKKFFDNNYYIPKSQINLLDSFYDNSIKKYCITITYGSGGVSIAFENKTKADETAKELIQIILN